MKSSILFNLLAISGLASAAESSDLPKLRIGITKKVPAEECVKAKNGDLVSVHYTGTLADGTVFDSSLTRGQPIDFPLGVGRVIQGWDQGILGMCIGEKRKLTIPPHLGYGSAGAGAVIPPDATLIFTTELVAINGDDHKKPAAAAPESEPTDVGEQQTAPEGEPEAAADDSKHTEL